MEATSAGQVGLELALDDNNVEAQVKKILESTEKTAKSKAASISQIYKKQGMDASDAMKKAWKQIERGGIEAEKASRKISLFGKRSVSSANESVTAYNGLNNTFEHLNSSFKRMLMGAFTVFGSKLLADFGKQCIELGSDLAEVQNVVDVTFTTMSAKVDKFTQNAAKQFGLSETMAKRYTGTFGAMAKAFGFSEKQAYDMSTALTGLAGDVASFYNIRQDEAYTKLKSVFTGETESLKDLGVVMTQTALDQYAMQNGFGKTTKAMSEQEKVALRYAFVQSQLNMAAGDFSRTSGSWANQVRLLTLQFESLKASIGQGLIAAFTPAIRVVNLLIGRLLTAINTVKALFASFGKAGQIVGGVADKFKKFTGNTDKSSTSTKGLSDAGDDAAMSMQSLGSGADSAGKKATKASKKAGDAAKKAAKKMRSLMGFDQINKVDKKESTGSSGSGGSGGSAGSGGVGGGADDIGAVGNVDTSGLDKATGSVGKLDKRMRSMIKRAKELKAMFMKGFRIGFGDSDKNIKKIKRNLKGIGDDLRGIFTDKNMQSAANKYLDRLAESLGKGTGALASIGVTIATNLTGGFKGFLDNKKGDIKKWIADMFDISGDIAEIKGNFAVAVADIFSAFSGKNATKITTDAITIIWTIYSRVARITKKIRRDLLDLFTGPIIQNKGKIKKVLDRTLGVFSKVTGTISRLVTKVMDGIEGVYDKHVSPLIKDIKKGVTKITGILLDGYNKYVVPVLDKLADKFDKVIKKDVMPMLKSFGKLVGQNFDIIRKAWNKILVPILSKLAKVLMPVIGIIVKILGTLFLKTLKTGANTLNKVFKILSKVLSVLNKIQNPIKVFKKAWDGIKDKKAELTAEVKEKVEGALAAISEKWEGIKDKAAQLIGEAKEKVSGAIKALKDGWESVKDKTVELKAQVASKWSDLKDKWNGVVENVKDKAANMKAAVASKWNDLKEKWSRIVDNIKDKAADLKARVASKWADLKSKWSGIVNNVKNKTADMKARVASKWSDLRSKWNSLLGNFKDKTVKIGLDIAAKVSNIKKAFNDHVISPLNSKIHKIPLLKSVSIPYLAQGGFVKKNTPQLAMIGDNRHQGEIVAPEGKLEAMAINAAKLASGGGNQEMIALMRQMMNLMIQISNRPIYLDGKDVTDKVVKRINDTTKSTGNSPILI